MATTPPTAVRIRAYDVGFGDCFLLTFRYPGGDRHLLIDFGSFPKAKRAGAGNLPAIAAHIRDSCNGQLHAVVATHRHADHINGFARNANGTGSGDIIRGCRPEVVVQPWTEHPKLDPEATGAHGFAPADRKHVAALKGIDAFLTALTGQVRRRPRQWRSVAKQLAFLGEDGISNRSAVENLMTMATTPKGQRYVCYGRSAGLGAVLPGVKVRVLGPPTIDQLSGIETQRRKDEAEFWHLLGASAAGMADTGGSPFAARHRLSSIPGYARWLVDHADANLRQQLLSIVRRMDDVLNNTSVILLFQVGTKKLLFPGDAQIENWSFALSKPSVQKLLADVDVYKVGHHGSLNATPKASLWEPFSRKGKGPNDLMTFLSTESGHHGTEGKGTEVPRLTLVEALQQDSRLMQTGVNNPGGQAVAFVEQELAV